MTSRSRRSACLLAGVAMTVVLSGSPAVALGADGGDTVRTIEHPPSGLELVITNEGDCERMTVLQQPISETGLRDVGVTHTLDYAIDDTCHVRILRGGTHDSPNDATEPTTNGDQASGKGGPSLTKSRPVGSTKDLSLVACGAYGNVIHGAQTLQDVINIDIAEFRYGHDRNWSTCTGKTLFTFGNWWLQQLTEASWNHAVGNTITYYNSNWVTTAIGKSNGSFHSDFLWCNMQAGENFVLYTKLTSYNNGNYAGGYTQSDVCAGTHMATATKADLNWRAW